MGFEPQWCHSGAQMALDGEQTFWVAHKTEAHQTHRLGTKVEVLLGATFPSKIPSPVSCFLPIRCHFHVTTESHRPTWFLPRAPSTVDDTSSELQRVASLDDADHTPHVSPRKNKFTRYLRGGPSGGWCQWPGNEPSRQLWWSLSWRSGMAWERRRQPCSVFQAAPAFPTRCRETVSSVFDSFCVMWASGSY